MTKYTENKFYIKLVLLYTIIFETHVQQNKTKIQNSMAKY